MVYTTEDEVYDRTGFNASIIQSMSGKTLTEVTTFVNDLITDAEKRIREDIGYPIRVSKELHLGDGDKNQFELGPEDDQFAEEGDYDPENGLIEVYNAYFGTVRMEKPYPEDCDSFTEAPTNWTASNATLTKDTSIKGAGTGSIKAVYTSSGYVRYPTSQNLNKNIDKFNDLFFWFRTTDRTITFTVRLYDKDGNYDYQTFTSSINNTGEYIWLDIDSFTGNINWDTTNLQYIEFHVSGACTTYVDNLCLADSWSFTAPAGIFHTSVAQNVSGDGPPSHGFPFYINYSYDPFLASVPANIAEAAEWMTGIYIIDYLRGIRYRQTSFKIFAETLELDQDASREALLGVRTKMEKNYWACLSNWGGGSYGIV